MCSSYLRLALGFDGFGSSKTVKAHRRASLDSSGRGPRVQARRTAVMALMRVFCYVRAHCLIVLRDKCAALYNRSSPEYNECEPACQNTPEPSPVH